MDRADQTTIRSRRPSRWRPNYFAPVDPAMAALGWRLIAFTYAGVLVPILAAFLPRDTPTRWSWLGFIAVFALATALLNLSLLRRMMRAGGFDEPPAWVPLSQAVMATVVSGGVNYALSGSDGFYRPIILVPTLLIAVIGNRMMVMISAVVALATLVVSSHLQGMEAEHLPALAFTHGATWGAIIAMVRLLSATALGAVRLTDGIADAAAVGARADRLDDGIERLLPVIGAWALATRVTAFDDRGRTDGPRRLLAHWPSSEAPRLAPSTTDLDAARDGDGAVVIGDRAVLVIEAPGGTMAVVIDGVERGRLDSLTYHHQLQKMAHQVANLMSRSRQIEHLESLGMTDSLTGLPNRRSLESQLMLARSTAHPPERPLSLAMIDLDNFKSFNDAHGHPAGDELLRQFASALRNTVRASDHVARYGGEEFCLLLPGTGADGARALIDQMRGSIRALDLFGLPAFSAGIAAWDGRESAAELLRRADAALYRAKADGKDRSVVADPPADPIG